MGGPRWCWGPPGRWIQSGRIQLVYGNSFRSIWEYEEAFYGKKIDWRSVVGEACPLCGRPGCWREIPPYWRTAIALFPFREGTIPVARFQCRGLKRTFSLLPHQLAPYHLYTVESMVLAVLLWSEVQAAGEGGASAAVEELPGDCHVTPWLLRHWLGVVLAGFRGGHSTLGRWYDLSGIHSGDSPAERLGEVYGYFLSFGSRGPPSRLGLRKMVRRYSRATGRPLLGVPSQERSGLSAR